MEYNLKSTVTVTTVQSDVDRMNKLLAMQGEQPATQVLCVVFPFVMLGIKALLSLITNWWVKNIIIPAILKALNKFKANICKEETETINPLEIV
jgi:hypothetical protein